MIECLYGIGIGLCIWHFSDAKDLPMRLLCGVLWPLFILLEIVDLAAEGYASTPNTPTEPKEEQEDDDQ